MARLRIALGSVALLSAGWLAGSACSSSAQAGEPEVVTVKCAAGGDGFFYAIHDLPGRPWQDLAVSVSLVAQGAKPATFAGGEYYSPLHDIAPITQVADGKVATVCQPGQKTATIVVR